MVSDWDIFWEGRIGREIRSVQFRDKWDLKVLQVKVRESESMIMGPIFSSIICGSAAYWLQNTQHTHTREL